MEIEALATAHDRRQNFLRFSRRENEFHVGWRLLQRFQKRVERGRGQHVHFVDDINFVARFGWRVAHVFAQLAHLLDAVVACAVNLQDIEAVAGRDLAAIVARAVRVNSGPLHAVERFRQNARGRSFADATRPDEQISVRQPVLRDGILEGA